jgi:hypothetical protein
VSQLIVARKEPVQYLRESNIKLVVDAKVEDALKTLTKSNPSQASAMQNVLKKKKSGV